MRVKRQAQGPRIPRIPGWYPDGAGRLRYFDGNGWTEKIRAMPLYRDIPEFAALPPYQHRVDPPRRRRLVRKAIGLVAAGLLVLTAVSQLGSLWAPTVSSTGSFVPLVSDNRFISSSSTICRRNLPRPHTLALTGASVSTGGSRFIFSSTPFAGVSQATLKRAIRHNDQLILSLRGASSAFNAMQVIPGSHDAQLSWQNAWDRALTDLSGYNHAMALRSSQARGLFKTTEKDLEWINVFATANQIPSCSGFATQLYS